MPRFVAYGKKNGKPVKVIYDNGKLICDSKEVVDEIMKFIDEVRTWETPMRFAKFRMWKHTAEHPFTYKYAIDTAIDVERWEGSYPTYTRPWGLDENIRKRLERMTKEEIEQYYEGNGLYLL